MRRFPSFLPRSDLTDWILDYMRGQNLVVGDGEAPAQGGWTGPMQDPSSDFIQYVVLSPGTVGDPTGPLADTQADFVVPYSITSYGLNRSMAEKTSEAARQVAVDAPRTMVLLGNSSWVIQQVRASSIGGVVRNDNAESAKYSEIDIVSFYMSKELSP